MSKIKNPTQLRQELTVSFAQRAKQEPPSPTFFSGSCPLLHLLPWLDTSGAAVIGPRSYGLCWWSQRVREAWGRVVPVHHPVRDSLPGRSFAEQRAHIVAARGPTHRPEQAVPSQRATQSGKPRRNVARSSLKVHLFLPFAFWDLLNIALSPSRRAVQTLHGFTYPC